MTLQEIEKEIFDCELTVNSFKEIAIGLLKSGRLTEDAISDLIDEVHNVGIEQGKWEKRLDPFE
jgi:hypothetical protein